MRRYENILIISPDVPKEEEEELLKRVAGYMEKAGAQVVRTEDWAVRKLAFPIKKKDRGHYLYFLLDMDEKGVVPLAKYYRTVDQILRHMFVNVDEKSEGPKKPPDQVVFDELEGEF